MQKGLISWLKSANPDILCLQELKAQSDQIDLNQFTKLGYVSYLFPAQKKGYSGVAIFTKQKPDHVEYGCGEKQSDEEGRVIRTDYGDISVMSIYAPSGSSGDIRQTYKMKWLSFFEKYIQNLKKSRPNLIISGDYNICHKAIDIHNPVGNANSSGFLPEEREWIDNFMNSGFIDSFRFFNKEPHNYTWWSFRANSRNKNLGWRIDYNLVSNSLKNKLNRVAIFSAAKHSDHCPILLEMNN